MVVHGNIGNTTLPVKSTDTIAANMVSAILKGGDHDWYRYNPALHKVGKALGFPTSKTLREALKRENADADST